MASTDGIYGPLSSGMALSNGTGQPGMGSGMAQSAAEILHLRPYWEQEYYSGTTNKQFSDWVRDPVVLSRYQNSPKIMPSPQTGQMAPAQTGQPQTGQMDLPQEDQQLQYLRWLQSQGR